MKISHMVVYIHWKVDAPIFSTSIDAPDIFPQLIGVYLPPLNVNNEIPILTIFDPKSGKIAVFPIALE